MEPSFQDATRLDFHPSSKYYYTSNILIQVDEIKMRNIRSHMNCVPQRRLVLLCFGVLLLLMGVAMSAHCETAIVNGSMEGPAVDQSGGKGLLMLPAGWTKVNVNENNGDRISVEQSDRPGGGQCLHIQTSGGGAYQTVTPLVKNTTYLVTAWVKRISGTINLDAYSHAWGPTIMRRSDDTSTGWTLMTAQLNTIDDGAHIYLMSSPKADYLIDDVQIHQAPIQVSKPEFTPYDFTSKWSYKVTLTPSAGVSVPDSVQVQPLTVSGKVLGPSQTVKLQPGKPTTVTVNLPVETLESFSVEVKQGGTGEILGGSIFVTTAGDPWIVCYPYKNSLYSSLKYTWSMKVKVLTATPAIMSKLQASASIIGFKGKVLKKASSKLSGDTLEVPIDGRGLAPGFYKLQVVIRKKGGKLVNKSERPLHVLLPTANEVVVGPNGDTLINGKKFFPIGLYWVLADPAGWKRGPARKTEDMLELRKAGFNTLHTYAFEHDNAEDTNDNAIAYLDMAQELGFKVMMGITRGWYQGKELNREAIEQRVLRLKDHPALLCWTLWDEPDGNVANVPRVQAVYDIVNKLDPYHPAMPVFMQGGGRAFRNAADINLFDYYPGAGQAAFVPGVLAQAKLAMPDKPMWYAAQAYNRPSEQDMRLFWQYALDADVKALFWYSYGGDGKDWDSIRNTPELFADVKKIIRELADKVGEK